MKLYIFIILVKLLISFSLFAQTIPCAVAVAIKNASIYHFDKIHILGRDLENIKPHTETIFFCEEEFYSRMFIDIKFRKGKQRGHYFIHPIDNIGDTPFTSGSYKITIHIRRRQIKGFNVKIRIKAIPFAVNRRYEQPANEQ